MIRPALFLFLCLLALFPLRAEETEKKEKRPETFVLDNALENAFSSDRETFLSKLNGGPFGWVSKEQTEMRGADAPMTYLGLPVLEVVFRFKDDKLSEVFLSLYNRGDAGEVKDDTFTRLIAKTEEALNKQSQVSGEDLGDTLRRVHLRSQSKGWIGRNESFRLDTAYSRVKDNTAGREERPEFVNITLLPGNLKKEDLVFKRSTAATDEDLLSRVEKNAEGDVLLKGVPMVDQGQKGYCAVATMERILRYYGVSVNQHELAQQADSSGQGGTDPESLLKALKSMGGKIGLQVDQKISFESKEFMDLIEDYNKLAKRKKERTITLGLGYIDIGEIYGKMDPALLREIKTKSTFKVEKFFSTVSDNIEKGHPVPWSVILGLIEEEPKLPQGTGGHMRLIIGFNRDKKEILYSDSWGYGHELKRMSLDDAFTITSGLYTVDFKP